jgi:hypothetical protein
MVVILSVVAAVLCVLAEQSEVGTLCRRVMCCPLSLVAHLHAYSQVQSVGRAVSSVGAIACGDTCVQYIDYCCPCSLASFGSVLLRPPRPSIQRRHLYETFTHNYFRLHRCHADAWCRGPAAGKEGVALLAGGAPLRCSAPLCLILLFCLLTLPFITRLVCSPLWGEPSSLSCKRPVGCFLGSPSPSRCEHHHVHEHGGTPQRVARDT